jgi:Domain of unknown function (DUF4157)/Pretoxin HINT domain
MFETSQKPAARVLRSGATAIEETKPPEIPKTPGEPLREEERAIFERIFGIRLDEVRVHAGQAEDEAAEALGADAFAVRTSIFLSRRSFAEGSPNADRILAHELMHVVQFQEGRVAPPGHGRPTVSTPDEPLEAEAYAVETPAANAAAVLRSNPQSPVSPMTPSVLAAPPVPPAVIARRAADDAVPPAGPGPTDDELVPPVPKRPTGIAARGTLAPQSVGTLPQPKTPGPPAPAGRLSTDPSAVPQAATPETAPPGDMVPPAAVNQPVEAPAPEPEPFTGAPAVDLAGAPPPGAADAGNRAAAEQEAASIEAESQSLSSALDAQAQAVMGALDAAGELQAAQIQAAAAAARVEIVAAYDSQIQTVQAAVAASLAEIQGAHATQQGAIQAFGESQRARLEAARNEKHTAAQELMDRLRQENDAAGEAQAQRAISASEEKATAILAEAENAPVSGDQEVIDAEREASRRIATDTADKCRETGSSTADRVRQEAAQNSTDYGSQLPDYLEAVDHGVDDSLQNVEQFTTGALDRAEQLAQSAAMAVNEAGTQATAGLEREKTAALAETDAWLEQASTAIQQSAQRLRAPLLPEVTAFQQHLLTYGSDAASRLRSANSSPGPIADAAAAVHASMRAAQAAAADGLRDLQANAETGLGSVSQELQSQLSATVSERSSAAGESGEGLAGTVREAAEGAATGLAASTAAYQEKLAAGVDEALENLDHSAAQFESGLREPHQQALDAYARIVDDGLASEDDLLTKARADMASAARDIAARYEQLKHDAEEQQAQAEQPATRIHRGIWSSITGAISGFIQSVQDWFKRTFGEFWGGLLFGILSALVIVVVGLLLFWAAGAILAALGIAAAKVAIVLLVVGLVVAIGFGIYNRFKEFYADNPGQDAGFWRGLGLVGLGILDITGIPYIIEGKLRQRAFGRKLSEFEAGERMGQGIVFLLAALFTAAKLLKGRPLPVPDNPVRPPADIPVDHPPTDVPSDHPPTDTEPRDCFVAGTLILTANGNSPIETLRVNQTVRSFDPVTGAENCGSVVRTLVATVHEVLDIDVDGTVLTCTAKHPFWVSGAGWRKAADLSPGDTLLTIAGDSVRVNSVARRQGSFSVFNLEVAGLHTYFVSRTGILVHNKAMARTPLLERIRTLATDTFQLGERANKIPVTEPQRAGIRARIATLRTKIAQLQADFDAATPEERELILESDYADAETEFLDLQEEVEPLEPDPAPAATDPRPGLKYPKNKLPTGGTFPYESPLPSGDVANAPGGTHGYLDANGNVWQVDPTKARTGRFFEWDVQHPDGTHTNVGEDGNITH